MARTKTKKQKKIADNRVIAPQFQIPVVQKGESQTVVNSTSATPATVFSQSQVNLLYKDLLKTFIVTGIVVVVLLSIFLYMR